MRHMYLYSYLGISSIPIVWQHNSSTFQQPLLFFSKKAPNLLDLLRNEETLF